MRWSCPGACFAAAADARERITRRPARTGGSRGCPRGSGQHRGPDNTLERLRVDRRLQEALAAGRGPLHLVLPALFGILDCQLTDLAVPIRPEANPE